MMCNVRGGQLTVVDEFASRVECAVALRVVRATQLSLVPNIELSSAQVGQPVRELTLVTANNTSHARMELDERR